MHSGGAMGNVTAARVVAQIRKTLQEEGADAQQRLGRIVRCLGMERALALLVEAQRIEADGGMLTQDGQRRRTPGGVFYYLIRGELQGQRRYADLHFIWPELQPPKAPRPASAPPSPTKLPLDLSAIRSHLIVVGVARTVKVTLIGRPGDVHEQGGV